MITFTQYIQQQGVFVCKPSGAATHSIQFVVNNQPEAEFDGLTTQQLQQLYTVLLQYLDNLPGQAQVPQVAVS